MELRKRVVASRAECLTAGCDWQIQSNGGSAQGNGAQHAKRTGHLVGVEVEISYQGRECKQGLKSSA